MCYGLAAWLPHVLSSEKKGLMLLQRQRKALLDGIHKDQSCIEYLGDVLDRMRKGGT